MAISFGQLLILLTTVVVVGLMTCFPKLDTRVLLYQERLINAGIVGLGLASMIVLAWHRGNYSKSRGPSEANGAPSQSGAFVDRHNTILVDQMGFFLQQYSHTIGLYIFGAGTFFLQVCYLIENLQCIHYCCWNHSSNWREEDGPAKAHACFDEVSKVTYLVAWIPFVVMQMPLLFAFERFRRRRRHFAMHHATLVLIAANFAAWFYMWLRDTKILKKTYEGQTSPDEEISLREACLKHATVMYTYDKETLTAILAPFRAEFFLSAITVLMQVWLLPCPRGQLSTPSESPILPRGRPDNQQQAATWSAGFLTGIVVGAGVHSPGGATGRANHERESSESEDDDLDRTVAGYYYVPLQRRNHIPTAWPGNRHFGHRLWIWVIRSMNIYTAIVFGIIEIALEKFFLLHEDFVKNHQTYMSTNHFNVHVALPTMLGILVFNQVPSLLVVTHCWLVMRTFRERLPNVPGLHGSDVILILAAVAVIVLVCFQEFSFISQCFESEEFRWMNSLGALLVLPSMPQILLSALVICYGQRWKANVRHRYFDTLQGSLTYLTVYSFMQWARDSFLGLNFLDFLAGESKDEKSSEILTHLLLPPCIYFRFLSISLILKVKNLFREAEIRWKMENGVNNARNEYRVI